MALALGENTPTQQVFAGPTAGATFITPRGDPIPPSEVVTALAKISPRLKIEWINGAWGQSAFYLKEGWREGDPRWQRVQTGEMSEAQAFDVLTSFPREIRTDDMVAWVARRYGDRAISRDPRAEADRLVEQAKKLYAQADEKNIDKVVEDGTRKVLDENDHLRLVRAGAERAHPMVQGADLHREPKRLLEVVK
jgi:hypothetical protein